MQTQQERDKRREEDERRQKANEEKKRAEDEWRAAQQACEARREEIDANFSSLSRLFPNGGINTEDKVRQMLQQKRQERQRLEEEKRACEPFRQASLADFNPDHEVGDHACLWCVALATRWWSLSAANR